MDEVCPYCNKALDEAPQRMGPCSHCGKTVYVRTKQTLFPSTLLTDHQVASWELFSLLSQAPDANSPVAFQPHHTPVTLEDYHNASKRLVAKLGRKPFATEIVWSLAKRAASESIRKAGYTTVYWQMAKFLYKIGQDHIPVHRKHFEQQLLRYKTMGVEEVTIRSGSDGCKDCQRQDGHVLSVDTAIRTAPLPCINCTEPGEIISDGQNKGFCRCLYEY